MRENRFENKITDNGYDLEIYSVYRLDSVLGFESVKKGTKLYSRVKIFL